MQPASTLSATPLLQQCTHIHKHQLCSKLPVCTDCASVVCACLQVEMYADPSASGGVLEPQGIVEIKFRTPDLIAMMHRLDPSILHLKVHCCNCCNIIQ